MIDNINSSLKVIEKTFFSRDLIFGTSTVLRGSSYSELSKNRFFFFFFVPIDGTIIREYCRKILQSISE